MNLNNLLHLNTFYYLKAYYCIINIVYEKNIANYFLFGSF